MKKFILFLALGWLAFAPAPANAQGFTPAVVSKPATASTPATPATPAVKKHHRHHRRRHARLLWRHHRHHHRRHKAAASVPSAATAPAVVK